MSTSDLSQVNSVYLSYSKFRLFSKCQWAYKLWYVDKLRPEGIDYRRYIVGSVCHRCLNRWITESICLPAWMLTITNEELRKFTGENRIRWQSQTERRKFLHFIDVGVMKIQKSYFALGLHNRKIQSELLVEALEPTTGVWLSGRIDLYDTESRTIYDMKATQDEQWLDREQGLFYAILMGLQTGREINNFGHFLPLNCDAINKLVPNQQQILKLEKFDTPVLQEFSGKIIEAARALINNVFTPTVDAQVCRQCDMRRLCKKVECVGM